MEKQEKLSDNEFLQKIKALEKQAKLKHELISEQQIPQFSTMEEALEYYYKRGYTPVDEYIKQIIGKYGDLIDGNMG